MNPDEIQKALSDPETNVKVIEMTDELKARLTKICDEMMDHLQDLTSSPSEGFIVLHFMMKGLQECYGFRGFEKSKDEQGAA
jgi:hypothetical protein